MGEATRTSEARMRAAVQDVVTTLDRHGDGLTRAEAISVLGVTLGTYALAWGGEEEVVGKAAEVAKTLVLQQRAKAAGTLANVPAEGTA